MTLERAREAIHNLETTYTAAVQVNEYLNLPTTRPYNDVLYLPLFHLTKPQPDTPATLTPIPSTDMEKYARTAITEINAAFVSFIESAEGKKNYLRIQDLHDKLLGATAAWQANLRHPASVKVTHYGLPFLKISDTTVRTVISVLDELLISIELMQAGYTDLAEDYHRREHDISMRYRYRDIAREAMPT